MTLKCAFLQAFTLLPDDIGIVLAWYSHCQWCYQFVTKSYVSFKSLGTSTDVLVLAQEVDRSPQLHC